MSAHPIIQQMSRLYRSLLYAYPRAFREDYQDEMVWLFEDVSQARLQAQGWWAVVRYWGQIVPDWTVTVVRERLLQLGYQGAKQMDTTQFNQQLTSTLVLFTRALRSGHSVKQAFEIIANHAPEPTKSLFADAVERLNEGESFDTVLADLQAQVESSYLERVIEMLYEQRKTGGNLADKLDAINHEFYEALGDTGWARRVDLDDGYDSEQHYLFKA